MQQPMIRCMTLLIVVFGATAQARAVNVVVTSQVPPGGSQSGVVGILMPLGQSLEISGVAEDTAPPPGAYTGGTISGPVWTVNTQVFPAGQSGASITTTTQPQPSPDTGVGISIQANFSQPGDWTFAVQATATYTDSSGNTYTGSGTLSYQVLVVSVQMPPSPVYVGVGGTVSVPAVVEPPEAAAQVSFQGSSSVKVAGNAADLLVTGVSPGPTSITATLVPSDGQMLMGMPSLGSFEVDVISVMLMPSPVTTTVGGSVSLTAMVMPNTDGGQVSVATDDDTIATVSGSAPNLTVTGVANGTTNVTAAVAGQMIALAVVNVGSLTVTFSPSPVNVSVSSSTTLIAVVDPPSGAGEVTFDTAAPGTATVSAPTWDNDVAWLMVTGGASQGSTQVRAWAAGVMVAMAAVNVTPPPSVQITTQGNLELIQDPKPDLNKITLSAQITPTTDTIIWTLSGPGYNPPTDQWVRYTTGPQVGGVGSITIKLDANSGTWSDWKADSSVTVTASSAANPSVQSQVTVTLTKFRRNGQTAAGSLPVQVKVWPYAAYNPPPTAAWYTLMSEDGTTDKGWGIGTSVAEVSRDDEEVERAAQQYDSGKYRLYYYCTNDKGDGTYSFSPSVVTTGAFDHVGLYNRWSFGHGATVALASGRSASIDTTAQTVTGGTVGDQFNGSPLSLGLGITATATPSGGSYGVGLTALCQLNSGPDEISNYLLTNDSCVFSFSGNSTVGSQIDITHLLRVAAAADVKEQSDGEWYLKVTSWQSMGVPYTTYLSFQPGL